MFTVYSAFRLDLISLATHFLVFCFDLTRLVTAILWHAYELRHSLACVTLQAKRRRETIVTVALQWQMCYSHSTTPVCPDRSYVANYWFVCFLLLYLCHIKTVLNFYHASIGCFCYTFQIAFTFRVLLW